jgi:hypothetical protein
MPARNQRLRRDDLWRGSLCWRSPWWWGAHRIVTLALIDELMEGKVSAEKWAKVCEELGIMDLRLAGATESAPAST